MKLILGTALAVGVVLGAGPTVATNLVDDEITVVEEVPTSTEDETTTDGDDPEDPEDPEDPADESGDEESGEDSDEDGAAVVNYGKLVSAWVHCTRDAQEAEAEEEPSTDAPVEPSTEEPTEEVPSAEEPIEEPVTDCGDRPHPPGNAVGWDAAHAEDHGKGHGKKSDDADSDEVEGDGVEGDDSDDPDESATHGKGHAKKSGKGSHKH